MGLFRILSYVCRLEKSASNFFLSQNKDLWSSTNIPNIIPPLPHQMMSLDLFLLLIIISAKAETLLQFQLGHTHIYVSWNFSHSLPRPPAPSFLSALFLYWFYSCGAGAEGGRRNMFYVYVHIKVINISREMISTPAIWAMESAMNALLLYRRS